MFERIGGLLGLAFYAAQAVALGGGLIVRIAGGNGDVWLRWTVPPMAALGIALMAGMPAWGAALVFWRLVTDTKYGNG